MKKSETLATLEEMIEYFARCFMNAVEGGTMHQKFHNYIEALEEAKKLLDTERHDKIYMDVKL